MAKKVDERGVRISKTILQKEILQDQAIKLFAEGKTELMPRQRFKVQFLGGFQHWVEQPWKNVPGLFPLAITISRTNRSISILQNGIKAGLDSPVGATG